MGWERNFVQHYWIYKVMSMEQSIKKGFVIFIVAVHLISTNKIVNFSKIAPSNLSYIYK